MTESRMSSFMSRPRPSFATGLASAPALALALLAVAALDFATRSARAEPASVAASSASGATPAPGEEGKAPLNVMTFNVLCSFCDRTNFDPWEERLGAFADIVARHAPDVIGFQELAKEEEVLQIAEHLPGFDFHYYKETEPKEKAYPDATIAWRADRFVRLEAGNFWLSDTPDTPWTRGWAKGPQFWRLVAWVRLLDKRAPAKGGGEGDAGANGRELVVFSTHFDNNKPNQEMSAPILLERVARVAGDTPCVILGDFNSKPDTPAYASLTTPREGDGFRLVNTFDLAPAMTVDDGGTPLPEGSPALAPYDPAHRIDHMFVAGPGLAGPPAFEVDAWRVDRFRYGTLGRFPSDHFAMSARLRY